MTVDAPVVGGFPLSFEHDRVDGWSASASSLLPLEWMYTAAPPGGYARGLDKAEADLVYLTVRKTLAAVGLPVKPEWFPPNDYQAQRLDNAYARRGLDPTPLDR